MKKILFFAILLFVFESCHKQIESSSFKDEILYKSNHSDKIEIEDKTASCCRLETINKGLVAYFPFSGNANDASGNNKNGIVHGAILTTDRFGNANSAYFFGDVTPSNATGSLLTNYIIVPNLNENNVLTYSISGWFQKSISSYNREGTIFCGDQPLNGPGGLRFAIGSANNTQWNAEFQNNTSVGVLDLNWYTGVVNYSDGKWHHFCATFNSPPGTISPTAFQVFIDGVLIPVTGGTTPDMTFVTAPINNGNLPTIIGNLQGPDSPFNDGFPGKLDDIRVYNRVLTQSEITCLSKQ